MVIEINGDGDLYVLLCLFQSKTEKMMDRAGDACQSVKESCQDVRDIKIYNKLIDYFCVFHKIMDISALNLLRKTQKNLHIEYLQLIYRICNIPIYIYI